jgi:Tol biopolymer transport system component
MRRVIRRILGAAALVLLLASGVAMAAAPAGPRLAVVKFSAKLSRSELMTINPDGGHPLHLAEGGKGSRLLFIASPLSWAPGGERGVFSGVVGVQKGDDHEPVVRLFTVRADGGGLRAIRGTNGAVGPVFSPAGRTVAFTRSIDRETPTTVGGKRRKQGFHGASIWIVNLLTGAQRQLTPWRDGLIYIASSFSPDGSTLLATHEDDRLLRESEPVALAVDGSGSRRLLEDGSSPVYSPDGSRIALVRRTGTLGGTSEEASDLYVVNADGSGVRRLTNTPGSYEIAPSWDPSGERLAYVRFRLVITGGERPGTGEGVMQINADGSCPTKAFSALSIIPSLSAPTWQPGPGREAGRIEC